MNKTAEQTTDEDRRRWLALYVLCAGMLMIVLDVTVVNVALPSIQTDLHFTPANLAWVVNAYLIAFGGLLLLSGRLGDLVGRRRVFLVGLSVFTLASLLCAAAQSEWVLVAARFVQGVGGALTSAVILGMIVTMFPERREQARAIGVYGFVASAGGSVGLIAGGALTQLAGWHWIFFINVPVGLVVGVLALRLLAPETGIGLQAGADLPGALLITSSLMLGVYAIVGPAATHGWGAQQTLLIGGASLVLLGGFVLRQEKATHPLMPLRIVRERVVGAANVIQALIVSGMFGMFFMGSLYLQRVLHFNALQIGLAFLPLTVVMGTLSLRYADRLMLRFGPRRMLLIGVSLAALSLALLARVPVHGSYLADILPEMLLLGVGMGISFPSIMSLAMSAATPQDAGLASGLVSTSAQVGAALGLAVLATLAATRSTDAMHAGHSPAAALTSGYHLAFLIGALLLVAAALLIAGVLRAGDGAIHEAPAMRAPEPLGAES